MVDESLYAYKRSQLELTRSDFHRYLYDDINWNARMVAITGARGVGKSTMVLQYLKSRISDSNVLYISADHTYFSTHKLVEVADEFSKEDGKLLVIDEVHKYPEWSRDLKQQQKKKKKMLAVISLLDTIQAECRQSGIGNRHQQK